MNRYVTVGLGVLAGAALFEAALIPGIVIGGAAVLGDPTHVRSVIKDGKPVDLATNIGSA